jgi:hypothetical protein
MADHKRARIGCRRVTPAVSLAEGAPEHPIWCILVVQILHLVPCPCSGQTAGIDPLQTLPLVQKSRYLHQMAMRLNYGKN